MRRNARRPRKPSAATLYGTSSVFRRQRRPGAGDLRRPDLSQTRETGLDQFTYLERTDAYYHFHGDTNALTVVFSAGERQGSIIRLYYDAYGSFLGDQLVDSWACVTLEDRGKRPVLVRLHQLCNMPAIPTAYPDWGSGADPAGVRSDGL